MSSPAFTHSIIKVRSRHSIAGQTLEPMTEIVCRVSVEKEDQVYQLAVDLAFATIFTYCNYIQEDRVKQVQAEAINAREGSHPEGILNILNRLLSGVEGINGPTFLIVREPR